MKHHLSVYAHTYILGIQPPVTGWAQKHYAPLHHNRAVCLCARACACACVHEAISWHISFPLVLDVYSPSSACLLCLPLLVFGCKELELLLKILI